MTPKQLSIMLLFYRIWLWSLIEFRIDLWPGLFKVKCQNLYSKYWELTKQWLVVVWFIIRTSLKWLWSEFHFLVPTSNDQDLKLQLSETQETTKINQYAPTKEHDTLGHFNLILFKLRSIHWWFFLTLCHLLMSLSYSSDALPKAFSLFLNFWKR